MTVVMVTGANRGIGMGLTKAFLKRGDIVVATYRDEGRSQELLSLATRMGEEGDERLILVVMELRDTSSIDACYDVVASSVDHLDILVNNAGMGDGNVDMVDWYACNTFGHLRAAAVLDMFAVNSVGPILLTQRFYPLMEGAETPKVVHITSIMGSISSRPGPGEYGYCASKTALNNMGHIMASDLEGLGIVSILLHPGWVRTTLGGPSAPLSVEESVAGLMRVIDSIGPEMNGGFFDYLGREIAW